jgi:hypothetical protein
LFKTTRKNSFRGFADILHPPKNVGGAQFVHGMSGGVHNPTHLAYLVRSPLKRRNSPAYEAGDDILRRQAGTAELAHNPVEGVDSSHCTPGIVCPVLHLVGRDIDIFWQIDQIHLGCVLHVEEGLLPLFA